MLISRHEKINASAVWGPPEAWGARAHRAHWIRRLCTPGRSPADKRFLVNKEHKIKHLTTTILTGFLIN